MLYRTLRCLVIIIFFSLPGVNAGEGSFELPRASLLGLAPVSTEAGQAVAVQYTLPGGTASRIGMQQGDKLVSLNGHTIGDFGQLLTVVQAVAVGTKVQAVVERESELIELTGIMQPRPYEQSANAEVVYGTVSHKQDLLRSITYFPKSLEQSKLAPAIYFIQGYTCGSIDYGMSPEVTTLKLIEQFVDAGYVVFRSEKPGVGDSRSGKPCQAINFSEESDAFLSGLKALKQMDKVDQNQVYLWGHSLGVLHSAVLANKEPVAGVIGYGGVYKGWHDYMLDIYRVQAVKHFGTSQKQANANAEIMAPFLDKLLNTDTPWHEILQQQSTKRAFDAGLLAIDGEQYIDRHYSFFRDINQVGFQRLWRDLRAPVLMIHGSLDIQAISSGWTMDIVAANRDSRSKGLVIEGAEHAFMRYENQQQYRAARNSREFNPAQPGERFDYRIGQVTLDWLESLKKVSGNNQYSGINNITFDQDEYSKNFVGNGFLIAHQDKTYAVTVKHTLLEARVPGMDSVVVAQHIADWRIHPNQEPGQFVRLGKLLNAAPEEPLNMDVLQRDWLLFEVLENKSNLAVLELRGSPPAPGETLTAYGCSYSKQSECKQDAYSGNYIAMEGANLRIAMPGLELGKLRGLSGSPVLDENQQVVGIVSNILRSANGEGFDFAPANLDYLRRVLKNL